MDYTSRLALTACSSSRTRKPLELRQVKEDLPGAARMFFVGSVGQKKKKKQKVPRKPGRGAKSSQM